MKALIWIGCMILSYIMQIISKSIIALIPVTDDRSIIMIGVLSGILGAISACFCIWLAIKLCQRLDWHRVTKKAKSAGMSVSEYGIRGISEERLAEIKKWFKTLPLEQVKPKLKALIKEGEITKEQYIILLKENTVIG